MENRYVSGETITIINPSQLVELIDGYMNLSKNNSPDNEVLKTKETEIFKQLGERKNTKYPKLLLFEIDFSKICDQINEKYQDGFYLDEEYDVVKAPFDRSIRTKPTDLDAPTVEKELSLNKVTSIEVGKTSTMAQNNLLLKRLNTTLLAFSYNYENSDIGTRKI